MVAAASAVVRAGLEAMVRGAPSLAVVGSESQPHVVLMEGGEDLAAFVSTESGPAVVVLSDDAGLSHLKAGARGVLPTGAGAAEIVAAIEAVAAGLMVLHPDSLEPVPAGAAESGLTGREAEVLRMLAEGLANKEIAYRLGISEHTVKFHVAAVFGKLHVSSRTEAVTMGVRQGLIML